MTDRIDEECESNEIHICEITYLPLRHHIVLNAFRHHRNSHSESGLFVSWACNGALIVEARTAGSKAQTSAPLPD
jgi:hypothetical protein